MKPFFLFRRYILLSGLLIKALVFDAQETETKNSRYFEAEYMVGRIIPNLAIKEFPDVNAQQVFSLSFGTTNNDSLAWGRYYNFPESGFMFAYSNLGNNQVFGHQLSLLPYIALNLSNKAPGRSTLKIGAGIAYFSTFYDSISNPTNEVIGSRFTWDIKLMLYQRILHHPKFSLKAGFGFSHESNGHTKLPNLGANSALFSLSGQFYRNELKTTSYGVRDKIFNVSPKHQFLNMHVGYGFHEQDPTEGPRIDRTKPVYSSEISYGMVFRNHIKSRVGLVYRFYDQYYTHLKENIEDPLNSSQKWSSSNVILFVGNEFLMGHIGTEIRFGLNLQKRFYRAYNKRNDIGTSLRKLFSSRVGLNLYLKNANELQRNNLFVGAHINANMMKADFTEFVIGYTVYLLRE